MKTRIYLFALMLMCSGLTATTQLSAKELNKEQTEVRAMQIKERVEQIRSMDLKHLNSTERVSLKHELKGMKTELRQMDGVIFISAGALILIIILILILL